MGQNCYQMIFTNEIGGPEVVALQLASSPRENAARYDILIPG